MKNAPVQPIPDGYHTLTPYLIINGALKAIEFYKKAFDAKELCKPFVDPKGKVGHAELQIGNSRLMIADEFPEMGAKGPQAFGGSPISLLVYVENVDKSFAQAVAAGGREVRPVKDQFYGDRSGQLEDPFGHTWTIATHKEDVSEDEMRSRAAKLFGSQ